MVDLNLTTHDTILLIRKTQLQKAKKTKAGLTTGGSSIRKLYNN